MTDESWFAADVGGDFEESVRIDREDDGRDHRLDSIDTYHVTEESSSRWTIHTAGPNRGRAKCD